MQLLSGVSRDRPRYEREQSAGSHLPYARHVTDGIVALRDGNLMQMLRLDGLLFETADADEINYRKVLRDAMLRAIGTSRFALYHHVVRRRVRVAAAGTFPDAFSRALDEKWQARLTARALYANELFVTIVRRPLQGRTGMLDATRNFLGRSLQSGDRDATIAAECRALAAATDQLVASLASYGARRLTLYDTPAGPCSEPLELLSTLYNATLRPVRLPLGDLGDYLPYRRISFGHSALELAPAAGAAKAFAAIVSIKDYPGETTPGMLDEVLRIPGEMVLTQSFALIDRAAGLGRMNLALRRMRAADDEALSLRAGLAQAKDDFAAGKAAFGEHHMTILLRGASLAEVDAMSAEAQGVLAELGIVAVREDVGLEPAFWAQFPGNFRAIARRAIVSSANFAALASSHNFPIGQASGACWGSPVTTLETTAAGPYHFNFHHGDLGNFTLIGPSGSGKTVILTFLLAQARRFRPRIVLFDKDRGAELFIRAIGGAYDVLRPNRPSRLNPLRLADTPENRRFLGNWLARLVQLEGEPLTPEERAQIDAAIAANFAAPTALRRLGALADLFRGDQRPHPQDLYARLQPWCGDGAHAWLFDNVEDGVDLDRDTLGFDMTHILDDPLLRTPAMMYLFHRVEERLDGSPAIIVVDEGWKALDDAIFVAQIRDWEKTIRKKNGIFGFVTQNASDALSSRIGSAVIEQSATQIFTVNPKARAEDYIDGFGLTAHEFEIVRALPDTAHCFLLKHGAESVVARLDLSGERDLLIILSGRESVIRKFDAIRADVGDAPAAWMPELLKAV